MSINKLEVKKKIETRDLLDMDGEKTHKERSIRSDLISLKENNLNAKSAMVTELVAMGFSLEAIERILKLKSNTLDRLLSSRQLNS